MRTWNAAAAKWFAQHHGQRATSQIAIDTISVRDGSVIVDVGCGTGTALRYVATRASECTLIGIDSVPHMLELARQATQKRMPDAHIDFRHGSATELPVDDAVADLVFAMDSFDYWGDQHVGLSEIRRILTPKGCALFAKDSLDTNAEQSAEHLRQQLECAAFVIEEEREVGDDSVSFKLWRCSVDVPRL